MRTKKLNAIELATRLETRTRPRTWLSKYLLLGGLTLGTMNVGTALADGGSATAAGNTVTDQSSQAQAYGFGTAYGQSSIDQGLSFGQAFATFGNLGDIIGAENAAAVAAGICDAYGAVGEGPCAGANAEADDEDGTADADCGGDCGCGGSCGCS